MPLPIVLVHGYSDRGESFKRWASILRSRGYRATPIRIADYQTLTNEITIKDIAEAFDRALRVTAELKEGQPFDAVVHSTGMLVVRSWLVTYARRKRRLRHLIGLAPATFGSPIAHKGRSWLGAIFKGRKELGPDFLEAGDLVLDGLELASSFTWNLAHLDLVGEETFYGPDKNTPYPFVFCGTESYGGLRQVINEPGTDGTVRWAGCALNTRKIELDLRLDPSRPAAERRVKFGGMENLKRMPLILVKDLNHATIVSDPTDRLVNLVASALQVDSEQGYKGWISGAEKVSSSSARDVDAFQQFVVRALDERGDPITDYHIQLFTRQGDRKTSALREFALDVHAYSGDKSLRCFHVNLSDMEYENLPNLWTRLIASSGTELVSYTGYRELVRDVEQRPSKGEWSAEINLSGLLGERAAVKFFYPFTTTLVEVRLDREPSPTEGVSKLLKWVGDERPIREAD